MSALSPQSGPLAFGDFLDHLRRQGFNIGVDHHLRLQLLLTQLGGRCAPQDLKTLLCPVFATSEKEQQLFHRAFDSYFQLFQVPAEPERKSSSLPDADVVSEEPVVAPGKSRWRSPLGYTLLAVLLITLAVLIARNPEVRKWFGSPPTPAPLQTQEPPLSPEPSTSTSTAPSIEVSPSETVSTPAVEQTPQQPAQSATDFVIAHRNAIRIAAVAIPLLCFLIYELIRYRRRKLILERARGRKPPRAWPIAAPSPELKDYRSERFFRAARGLRRRQVGEFHRLDVARTIAATIEARGYPNFRYRPDSRVPEYLILIDRASWRDHRAALFDALARAMEREGLFVQRYFFDGDPRICTDDATLRSVSLTDLQKKYPAHRLLIFGDGERLIDPVSGKLASWAALLLEWPDRALLTTEPRRGLREKTLADHFILLPATLEGLGELAERFDMPTATEFDSWEQYDEPLPPDPEGSIKIEALRGYLGEEAFQWLCACAVYPELHWELTLYLGSLPCMGAGQSALISERNLLRLIRLPWFRLGLMPDELQLQLIGELEPQRERAVRSAIIELLEKNPAPHGSFAADARRLEITAQRSWLSRDNRKELRQEVEEIRKFPPSDVVRDYALVRFLESAPSSRLAFLLPSQLKILFFEKGISAFGLNTGIRAFAMLVTMTAAFIGAMQIPQPEKQSEPAPAKGLVRVNSWTLFDAESIEASGATSVPGADSVLIVSDNLKNEALWMSLDEDGKQSGSIKKIPLGVSFADPEAVTYGNSFFYLVSSQSDPKDGARNAIVRLSIDPQTQTLRGQPEIINDLRSFLLSNVQEIAALGAPPPMNGGLSIEGIAWDPINERLLLGLRSPQIGRQALLIPIKLRDPRGPFRIENLKVDEPRVIILSLDGSGVRDITYDPHLRSFLIISGAPETLPRTEFGLWVWNGQPEYRPVRLMTLEDRMKPEGITSVTINRRGFVFVTGDAGSYLALHYSDDVASRAKDTSPGAAATVSSTQSPTATPLTLARLRVTPRSLDFGTVGVPGYTPQQAAPDASRKTVTVINTGAASNTVTRVAIDSEKSRRSFTIGKNSCSGANFQPRERCSIEVIFSPRILGPHSANLFINTAFGQQTVSLFGYGALEQKAPTDNEQNRQNSAGDFTIRGAFEGRVFDVDTKEPLVGARATITNKETYISRTVSTDKAGRYYFGQLAPGIYDFTFSYSGYESSAVRDVRLSFFRDDDTTAVIRAGGLRKIRGK